MKQLLDYVKKNISWLNKLAKDENLSLLWVYWDYLWAVIIHRCLIRQYVIGEFWKKSNAERKKCLTYFRIVSLFKQLNKKDYVHFLNEKPQFNAYFKDFIDRGWLNCIDASENEFVEFIKNYNAIIIKPVDGVEGGGIRKFILSDNPDTDLSVMFQTLKKEKVLIEEIIKQHPQMVFGNTSVNTIRTHTILGKDGKGHVIKAILRAGVGNSVVDNYAQGGSIYEVDIKTGLVCTYGMSHSNAQSYIHPQTDIVMLGYKIPNWDKVIEISERAAESLPQIGFIGWDVAITTNGVQLIEGNHNPDYELFEFLGSGGYYEKIKRLIN